MTWMKIDPIPTCRIKKTCEVFFFFLPVCALLLPSPVANSPLGYSSGARQRCAPHVPCTCLFFLVRTEFASCLDAGCVLSRVCGCPLLSLPRVPIFQFLLRRYQQKQQQSDTDCPLFVLVVACFSVSGRRFVAFDLSARSRERR